MKSPTIEFFKNVLRINHFCESAEDFSALELENKPNGSKLYLRLLDPKEVDRFNLIFFPDRKNALKFVDFENDENIDPTVTLGGALNKNGINALLISISFPEEGQKTSFTILGYGKYQNERLIEEFYNYLTDYLSTEDLRIKFLTDKPRKTFQLTDSKINELLLNALYLYPIFLDEGVIFDYESMITGNAEYFRATSYQVFPDDNDEDAFYVIYPNKEAVEKWLDGLKENNEISYKPGDSLFIHISKKDNEVSYYVDYDGDVKEYSQKEKDSLLKGFLLALERIRDEALREHLKQEK